MIYLKNYFFKGLSKNTFYLALSSFFADIATEMLYPILPIFLTHTLGASGSIVGLMEGLALAIQNLMQGLSGFLSDKIQKRKKIALIGYIIAAMAKPLMGFSKVWPELLGLRFLDRLGTGIRSAPRDALIASSVDKNSRGKAFGLEGFGDNLGAFLGPLLCILLLGFFKIDIQQIFYIAFIPSFLAFLLILLVKEERTLTKAKVKLDIRFKPSKIYWKYLLVIVLFGIGNSTSSFIILKIKETGISLELTILIYAFFNLAAAVVSYPAGFISDLIGRRAMLLMAFVIFIISYLGFALSQNIILIAILFIFYGVFQGIFRSIGKAYASDLVPTHLRATGIGWYNAIVGLLSLISSIIAGLLWDHIGHAFVFIFGAFFAGIASLFLFILLPKKLYLQ